MVYVEYNDDLDYSRWGDVSRLNKLVDSFLGVNLYYAANRSLLLSAISKLSFRPPFARHTRFPPTRRYIRLDSDGDDVESIINDIQLGLSARDAGHSENGAKIENKALDMSVLSVIKKVDVLRRALRRTDDHFDRTRFEREYDVVWSDGPVSNASAALAASSGSAPAQPTLFPPPQEMMAIIREVLNQMREEPPRGNNHEQ